MILKSVILCFFLINICDGAKILGVFNMRAPSHYFLGKRLLEELSEKGHQVTMICPFEEKNPPNKNYKNIYIDGMEEHMEKSWKKDTSSTMDDILNLPSMLMTSFVYTMGYESQKYVLDHPKIKKLLESDETFDAVVIEQFANEALKGLCFHYKVPCIAFVTTGVSSLSRHLVMNPAPATYIPEVHLDHGSSMNLFQRIYNLIFQYFVTALLNFHVLPKENALLHEHFPNAPSIYEIMNNVSLLLINSHISTNQPVALMPNLIEVGGFHAKPPKKLPDELQKLMDKSKEGVILFSFGSNVKSAELSENKRKEILKAFSNIKMRVLWKFEDENMEGVPKNVYVSKWFPQQDLLAHPNMKLFITHGGLLSLIESVYNGVPLIGIPFFGDQGLNLQYAQECGFGIKLNYQDLTAEVITGAVDKVLQNPTFYDAAKRHSSYLHDRPMTPADTAAYWIEYVIRHKGGQHFRNRAFNLPWYQYYLLDVLAVFAITIFSFYYILKALISICRSKSSKKEKQKMK